jgi:hypothetical protein
MDTLSENGNPAEIDRLREALRAAEKMLSGIYREIELPGEWEDGASLVIDECREALKN